MKANATFNPVICKKKTFAKQIFFKDYTNLLC